MRDLPARPTLDAAVLARLEARTAEIQALAGAVERRRHARKLYNAARGSRWFRPVVNALRNVCQDGTCMYCSANELSQVEHFRPLAVFPDRALEYDNYLWACDICNRSYKGDRFPPDTEPGAQILNPFDDRVWDHFFLNEVFGRLNRRLDPATMQPSARATSTCAVVGIDREPLQIRRQNRFRHLKRDIQRALEDFHAGRMSLDVLRAEIDEQRASPFQTDVTDYFLNGPGRSQEPFLSALKALGEL